MPNGARSRSSTKDMLRVLSDREFLRLVSASNPDDGIAEYWRSGGATGTPLFYPRSFEDIAYAMVGFRRIYECAGCRRGGRAHVSFPLGIHPVGQMLARRPATRRHRGELGRLRHHHAVRAAARADRPAQADHLDGHEQLRPAPCQPRPKRAASISRAVRSKRSCARPSRCRTPSAPSSQRAWGARVRDTFGMTEAGMMGAEDEHGGGFRIWTDMFLIEVLDPDTLEPVERRRRSAPSSSRRCGPTTSRRSCAGVRATW